MTENIILEVLAEQKEELGNINTKHWCNRQEERLFELDSPLAQVVIGVRRSGKSTICHKVLHEQRVKYAYANFDDDRLYDMTTADLNTLLSCVYQLYGQDIRYILLDEIQNVEGWHLFANRLLRMGFHVVITGSNAKLLSSELATHLTGRYNEIRLYPFSFSEYCEYNKVDIHGLTTKAKASVKEAFTNYLLDGGFPELIHIRNKRAYVQGLIDTVIKKDIKQRYHLRNIDALHLIANHLISNACQDINFDQLTELFGLGSAVTAKKYVNYLVQAFLVVQIHKFSFKSRTRLRASKGYVVDTGLIANRSDVLMTENYGWRMENVVYIELLRREVPLFHDVYYYKPSSRNKEVDFVVCEQGHVIDLVQVSYGIDNPKTFKRETDALIQAAENLHCANLTLVARSETRDEVIGGKTVHIVNIIEWLLSG